jgi:hypothetical protein
MFFCAKTFESHKSEFQTGYFAPAHKDSGVLKNKITLPSLLAQLGRIQYRTSRVDHVVMSAGVPWFSGTTNVGFDSLTRYNVEVLQPP